MSENGEIYSAGQNFTLPPALTGWTNSTSVKMMTMMMMVMALAENPIRTKSHKLDFVSQYGIMFVIIVINIIITRPKPAFDWQGLAGLSLPAYGAQLGSWK